MIEEYFPEILDVKFTANMESELDEVEHGEVEWVKVIDEFYKRFEPNVIKADAEMEKIEIKDEPAGIDCDLCGAPMVYKMGKYGKFLACSRFPDCRNTKAIVKEIGVTCPKCEKGHVIERKSKKKRIFYGCDRYPDCDYVSWDKPVERACPKCEKRALVEKKLKKVYKYNVQIVITKNQPNNNWKMAYLDSSCVAIVARGGGQMEKSVNVIGAGLAGSEAVWQLVNRGVKVDLYEMRPVKQTPAHHTDKFAELVCTNSLRANGLTNAVGVIKEEMRMLDSIIIEVADKASVPAGGALAVDRHEFSGYITDKVKNHPLVTVHTEEVTTLPEGPTIIATGPLTSPALADEIKQLTGEEYLYFYDLTAPIIEKDSIDMDKVYLKSRYDKGEAAYLNCPMSEEEFNAFYEALVTAETVALKEFEKEVFFEGCMPIEVMAKRGIKTMLFGPLKPVGLEDPKTGKRPYAVLQLRQDDAKRNTL